VTKAETHSNKANFSQDVAGNLTLQVTGDVTIKASGAVTIGHVTDGESRYGPNEGETAR
jgi:hypothetical protein